MLFALMAMVLTAVEKPRRANFERFWYVTPKHGDIIILTLNYRYTHHLFLIFFFFWSFHGAFCMIKPDREPVCDGIGVFWKFWMAGGLIYLAERVMREIRGKHKTYISKVIEHPSNVVEIQIKKEHTKPRAGQVRPVKHSLL